MRGADGTQEAPFTYKRLNDVVPADHPLTPRREILNGALKSLSPLFEKMYAREGRESIPPERPLRALVLQSLYSIRSERQLCASNSPTTCSMAA